MKPVEIVPRKGGRRENDGGGKSKIHSKHKCKYHNVAPCTTIICYKKNKRKCLFLKLLIFNLDHHFSSSYK
jgi:hypothetical protein